MNITNNQIVKNNKSSILLRTNVAIPKTGSRNLEYISYKAFLMIRV